MANNSRKHLTPTNPTPSHAAPAPTAVPAATAIPAPSAASMATAEAAGAPSRGIDFSGASGTAQRHDGDGGEDARRQRIAELAYRLAEQRGFAPGAELDDWISAERLVDADRNLPS